MPGADTLALAFGAGLIAAVNPCGFALLPAYLSLFVLDEQPSRLVAVGRAVRATAALTLGFAGVFLLFGLAIAPFAAAVQAYLPAFTIVLGLAVATAGGWVLAGRKLPSITVGRRPTKKSAPTASLTSMAGFGRRTPSPPSAARSRRSSPWWSPRSGPTHRSPGWFCS